MLSLDSLAIVLLLCVVLSVLSYRFGLLTTSGAVASFAVGMVIGVLGGIGWLLTLIVFTFLGFFVTKFRFQLKEKKGLQEGKKGERTYRNVLANGLVPAIIAAASFALGAQDTTLAAVVYISAVAEAASDTAASELGVLSDRTYLITTWERVPSGVDGGISGMGTLTCILAAVFASYIGWLVILQQLFDPLLLIPIVLGVAGCMIDSVIGATLETKGYVSKLQNNIMSMIASSVLAVVLFLAL